MFEYPHHVLQAAVDGLNTLPIAAQLTSVQIDEKHVVLTLQESAHSAMVVHLLPSGACDVLSVGVPSRAARHAMNVCCSRIAVYWQAVRYSPATPLEAAMECWLA